MVKDILGHKRDTLGGHICFFPVNIPHLDIFNIFFLVHRLDIVHTERKDILVVDSVNYRILMQPVSESLFCCTQVWVLTCSGILCEDRRTSESEQMILFELLGDRQVHITKLAPVALIKNDDHTLFINLVCLIFLDECGELLNGSDYDLTVWIFKLFLQNSR